MKGLGRVVVGSIAGGLLGAAAFFAVDGLMPSTAEAQIYANPASSYSTVGGNSKPPTLRRGLFLFSNGRMS